MNLSPQQQQAFDKIMAWHKTGQKRFVLAGYAGSGKTTLAQVIAKAIGNTVFCAYTGKAANVLREKGCEGTGTIHGFLYVLKKRNKKIKEDGWGPFDDEEEPEEDTDPKALRFGYSPKLEWLEADLIIVDEYSMLGEKLIEDIERDGKKILYLGDPFQLPPVSGECTLKPDFFIEEIHRQALESSIIRFSKIVREGGSITFGDHGDLKYMRQRQTAPDLYTAADQIIVGRNNTRQAWNAKFRKINQFISKFPVTGDKMICLKNNHEAGLFNGMIGYAKNMCEENGLLYKLDFDDYTDLSVWRGDVCGESSNYDGYNKAIRELERFDYAYAITCHKSQGSEFNNVLVYHQPIGGDMTERRRWVYTALTRGKKQVIMVEPA